MHQITFKYTQLDTFMGLQKIFVIFLKLAKQVIT